MVRQCSYECIMQLYGKSVPRHKTHVEQLHIPAVAAFPLTEYLIESYTQPHLFSLPSAEFLTVMKHAVSKPESIKPYRIDSVTE